MAAPEKDSVEGPEPATPGDITRDIPALRLNLLRLVHRHDQSPDHAIGRAKELEAYVLAEQTAERGRKALK